jgi:hypothetical protein
MGKTKEADQNYDKALQQFISAVQYFHHKIKCKLLCCLSSAHTKKDDKNYKHRKINMDAANKYLEHAKE